MSLPKKKILLVNTNTERSPYPVPPIGLGILASLLEKNYSVRIFDGVFTPCDLLQSTIKEFNPDFIGISIRNIDNVVNDNSLYYIDSIRENFILPIKAITNVPLILGGSGFSIFPTELLRELDIDYGIVGEGEESLPLLLHHLENNLDSSAIPGVISKKTAQPSASINNNFFNTDFLPQADIDTRIDFNPYKLRGAYSIQTKRGCIHKCIYCTYPLIEGNFYRIRKPSTIVDEIEQAYHRLGHVTFEFVDSIFNDPPGHAEAICRDIIKRKMNTRLRTMGINPSNTTYELFELMRDAGFAQIDCTPDSASPLMLKNLRKNFSLSELKSTAQIIQDINIPTMWFFIFGGPGENEQTISETFSFINDYINPEDMVYMIAGIRIYPGTRLYQIAVNEGSIKESDSILKPVFYISPEITRQRIDELIKNASVHWYNCIPASESTPPPEMMQKALELRKNSNLSEPMFRTLLRVRKEIMEKEQSK